MNTHCCSQSAPTSARKCLEFGGWMVPGAFLVLLPKCPACLAAYVAVATGFGISFQAARFAQLSLAVLGVALLLVMAARSARLLITHTIVKVEKRQFVLKAPSWISRARSLTHRLAESLELVFFATKSRI